MNEYIEKALKNGCTEAETYFFSQETQGIFFANNRVNNIQFKESTGLGFRVKKDDRLGFVSSSNLDMVDEVVDKAIKSSKYGETMSYSFPSPTSFPKLDIYDEILAREPIETYISRCEKFVDIICSVGGNIMVDCNFEKKVTSVHITNSSGLDAKYKSSLISFYSEVRLTDRDTSLEIEMQLDSHNDVDDTTYAESLAKEIPYLLKIKPIKTGKTYVIFTPDCFADLFMALETGLKGDAVARGISPLKDKIGAQVLDNRITIIDDSTSGKGKLAAPFDDEGTPGMETFLIRNGVLENYICDLKSASILNSAPTGNGLRSKGIYRVKTYSAKTICDFSNVRILPGSMTVDEMIESVKEGVLIQAIGGLLLANLTNGDYSGTIARGLKIENGKIVGRVTNSMLSGNFYHDFLYNLVDLSRETSCQGAFSGQIGSFDFPYALLKNITVSSQ